MTDIAITAANVVAGSNATREDGTAGETITAGQTVYLDPTTKKYLKADANSATAAARQVRGVALHGAALNQPLAIQKEGDITLGGTLVAGTAYYLSETPGGICARADLMTGDYVCLIGIAKSATVLAIGIQFPNVAL